MLIHIWNNLDGQKKALAVFVGVVVIFALVDILDAIAYRLRR